MDDLVEGILRISNIEGLNGEIINLGNPEEYNMLDIAEIILKKIKSQSKIVFKPLPEDDPRRRRPDISKAKDILNWEPQTPLDLGLKKTIKFFKSELLQ